MEFLYPDLRANELKMIKEKQPDVVVIDMLEIPEDLVALYKEIRLLSLNYLSLTLKKSRLWKQDSNQDYSITNCN